MTDATSALRATCCASATATSCSRSACANGSARARSSRRTSRSTNVGLDLLGQARLWFAYAGEVEARRGTGDEDALAFRRDAHEFRNLLLVEQPNGNYADTIARQFLFDHWHLLLLRALDALDATRASPRSPRRR